MTGRISLAASLVFLLAVLPLAAYQGKATTIKDVMKKAHDNKNGLRTQIRAESEKATPDWADVQKMTKEFVELAGALEANKPPKGDAAAWKKTCSSYVDQVKALDAAAGKKDAKAVGEANKKLTASCSSCHKAHRE
jgi:cytochrome c556